MFTRLCLGLSVCLLACLYATLSATSTTAAPQQPHHALSLSLREYRPHRVRAVDGADDDNDAGAAIGYSGQSSRVSFWACACLAVSMCVCVCVDAVSDRRHAVAAGSGYDPLQRWTAESADRYRRCCC